MAGCLAEDDLLQLVEGQRPLGEGSSIEVHLANCASCSALLATLLEDSSHEQEGGWGDLAGRSLGPYRLDAQIGSGAAGDVYRAWDERLSRHVAVKVLSPRVADSPEQVRRLEAEGRAAAAIAHPNVVTVHDVGSIEGMPFIVSELVDGESLRSVIARGAVSREGALHLGLQLARGLAAAHARGVVHRDLKPENLVVTRDGTLKILDFGLARLTGVPERRELDATLPGTVLGTAGYLSPEQARGEPADARSDLFAVGAILYELLSGQRAFGGATFAERLSSVLRDTPGGLNAETLGSALPVVARCLEKDASRRFQSAGDLAWALEALVPGMNPEGKRVAFIAADGRCLLLSVDTPGAVQVLPGSYRDEQVCGFREGGAELFVRSRSLPIRIRRVDLTTGTSVPHVEIHPPALGLKGVDALALSASGEAYAYSYGQELNRLYAMSTRGRV